MSMDPNHPTEGPSYPPPGNPEYPPPPAGMYGTPSGGAYAPPPPARSYEAIARGLVQKWINVTTKPGVESFNRELPEANWRDVWIGILALAVLNAITTGISSTYLHTTPSGLIGSLIGVPLAFFIGVGILFLIAKLFNGTGTFLDQSYATSLYYVPLQGIAAIAAMVPYLGWIVQAAVGIYGLVLSVFAVASSQRLTTNKAIAVVLIPAAIGLALGICAIALFASILFSALNGAR